MTTLINITNFVYLFNKTNIIILLYENVSKGIIKITKKLVQNLSETPYFLYI